MTRLSSLFFFSCARLHFIHTFVTLYVTMTHLHSSYFYLPMTTTISVENCATPHRHRHGNRRICYLSHKYAPISWRSISENIVKINCWFLRIAADKRVGHPPAWMTVCHWTRPPAVLFTWREKRWRQTLIYSSVYTTSTFEYEQLLCLILIKNSNFRSVSFFDIADAASKNDTPKMIGRFTYFIRNKRNFNDSDKYHDRNCN